MFLDTQGSGSWEPAAPKPRLSRRGEVALFWVLGFNILLLLIAPIGGATMIGALLPLLR